MQSIVKKLITQSVFYNASTLLFQSFIIFYIIKYYNGLQSAVIGSIVLYLAAAAGYIVVSRANHQRSINVKSYLFFGIVICLLSTCMMQWKTFWLLMGGNALLGFGKGIYFCALSLYEFEYVKKAVRVRYSSLQNAWKSGLEIGIPLVLGYLFSIIPGVQVVYLGIFLTSSVTMLLTALTIYQLPEFILQPLQHSHYRTILRSVSREKILYLGLVGVNVLVPFIGTLLDVKILQHESRVGLFQGITKGITLVVLLLILHYFHKESSSKHMIIASIIVGLMIIFTPRWVGSIALIIFTVSRSLFFPLFNTYEKVVSMNVMESMASEDHSMLPVIIVQNILYALIRVVLFAGIYFLLFIFPAEYMLYGACILTGICFIIVAWLVKRMTVQESI